MNKYLPFLFLLIATVAVIACGGGSDDEPETTDQAPSSTESEAAPESAATSTESEDSSESPGDDDSTNVVIDTTEEKEQPGGGVFRRLWADPPTLDPHLTGDTTSAGVVVEIFSGLVSINTDLELVPDIAQEWQVDDTGTVYTFTLRDNVTFHNGKKVTAEDFKWVYRAGCFTRACLPPGGHVPQRHRWRGGVHRGRRRLDRGHTGHRRADAPDHRRRPEGLLPGEAQLSDCIRPRPGDRRERRPKLVGRERRGHRPIQAR